MTARGRGVLLAVILLTGCSGSAAVGEEEVTTTSTSSTTSTSTTTLAPYISNLDVRVDPAVIDSPEITAILESLERMERAFPVPAGTVVILYGDTEPSVDWVRSTTRDVGCFDDHDASYFRNAGAQGRGCGLLMRFGKLPACEGTTWCKSRAFIAAHEYFHIVITEVLGNNGNQLPTHFREIPIWMHEGAADYIGYAFTYGSTPAKLSDSEIARFGSDVKTLIMDPNVNVGLDKLGDVWTTTSRPAPRWLLYAYHRAFLAVSLLIDKFGQEKVLVDYYRNISSTGDHLSAFEMTFGITEAEFDLEFSTWLSTL